MLTKETPPEDSTVRRSIKLLLKIGVTALCFWYISTKIDFTGALAAILKANWLFLFAALLFFLASKLASALRLNIYFRNIGLRLPEAVNIRLYLLGMFYNLFLPGAISGDAYKVVILNKRKGVSYKKASAAVLLDRFSGVLALGCILALYGIWMLPTGSLKGLFLAGAILSFLGFYLVLRFWMKDFLTSFFSTFAWSLAVQLCQVVSVYFIMASLGIDLSRHEWVFIFLCSAVISILPLSLGGGLGTREVVFAEGARIFHLDPALGVVISLLFYLVTVIGSLGGLYYQFYDPLRGKQWITDYTPARPKPGEDD